MASLNNVLASIPGYGGFSARNDQLQGEEQAQLGQVGKLMQLQQMVQERQQANEQVKRNEALRAEIEALPPEKRNRENVMPIILRHAKGAGEVMQALPGKPEGFALAPGHSRYGANNELLVTAPDKAAPAPQESPEMRMLREYEAMPDGDPRKPAMKAFIEAKQAKAAPQPRNRQLKDIVDPLNTGQMISIDVDTFDEAKYRASRGLNKTGIIGIAGKEPTAAKREDERGKGKQQITDIVDQMAADYTILQKSGALVDPKAGALTNIGSRIASSGVGQMVGGAVGTESQQVRDRINAAKPLIMSALKQASGMSSQQLNSNAELQFYLQAASDPRVGYQTNLGALAYLDKTYGLGTGVSATPEAIASLEALRKKRFGDRPAAASPAAGVPAGVDPADWAAMTPQERALWQK